MDYEEVHVVTHYLLLPEVDSISGQRLPQSLVLTLGFLVHHVLCPECAFVIFLGISTP